jgi:hypothetical protein
MHIQLNTDSHIVGSEELKKQVDEIVFAALERFRDRLTRVEVHLTDENSPQKVSENDKRCVMEARLAGIPPIAVTADAASIEQSVNDAAEKLRSALESRVGKENRAKGRTSFSGE